MSRRPKGDAIVAVCQARLHRDYVVDICFSDGSEQRVDFREFLLTSGVPDAVKYRNKSLFRRFNVRDGNLVWGDYEMIFPVEELYAGSVAVKSHPTKKTTPAGSRTKRKSAA